MEIDKPDQVSKEVIGVLQGSEAKDRIQKLEQVIAEEAERRLGLARKNGHTKAA